ncbi:MAG: DUF1064 domain-containing protein [Treponema sp.]|nr:DUF1064 domain-containing protein [Treponema sp.]
MNRNRPAPRRSKYRTAKYRSKYRPANCRSKYGARRTATYDSLKESRRAAQLRLLQHAGEIRDLKEQVRFELIPRQLDAVTGETLERACSYIADFTYRLSDGTFVVEDTKGYLTDVYRIKRKLMLYVHGIRIKET